MPLINYYAEPIRLHSGDMTNFKIDCDHLTDEDLSNLAQIVCNSISFKQAFGIPNGGTRFADQLQLLATSDGYFDFLLVDDVMTTGTSMTEARVHLLTRFPDAKLAGVVIFQRGRNPLSSWVHSIFDMNERYL
jgi:hypothetical protein